METSTMFQDTDAGLLRDLHADGDPSRQHAALRAISQASNGMMYADEVFVLASSTRVKPVYQAAMCVLRDIAHDMYQRIQTTHPWGERPAKSK